MRRESKPRRFWLYVAGTAYALNLVGLAVVIFAGALHGL